MNKTEKIASIVLGAVLVWYLFTQGAKKPAAPASQVPETAQAVQAARTEPAAQPASPQTAPQTAQANTPQAAQANAQQAAQAPALPETPEQFVTLENEDLTLVLSTWGGVVKSATLRKYAQGKGEVGDANPPVVFDFSSSPLGATDGPVIAYSFEQESPTEVVFFNGAARRKVSLADNYLVTYQDDLVGASSISIGAMAMGADKNDLLSVDSFRPDPKGGKVIHHSEGDSPLKGYLAGGISGGCSGTKSAAGLPAQVRIDYPGAQTFVALKNRFFVTALVSTSAPNLGFSATVARDLASAAYRPQSVSARILLDSSAKCDSVKSVFYVGPKKQALLWDLGLKDVMEFGMWRWICYPLVWVLNVFYAVVPNFGVAIILLTILVRLLFWPLTHKSTVGMKKMQEIQPLMKEIQAKYKDNPQRMQQETFALYREHKVNPMSSCLPMLIQIPVFIALFNVLRSAVELRYAPFLWIGDLSQPEGLFASWFPFGGLNILPILMAATMALQSALTPSGGDPKQQRMMIVMMPLMMLFMFYSFPSALSLYWTLSQVVSIVQMWLIRRSTRRAAGMPEVIDPPQTRQMRRHG